MSDQLQVHANARTRLDERATELKSKWAKRQRRQGPRLAFRPESLNIIELKPSMIVSQGPVTLSSCYGEFRGMIEESDGFEEGFWGTDGLAFGVLCEDLCSKIEPRACVNIEAVREVAFEWMRENDTSSFTAHCVVKLTPMIVTRRIWIPIASLHVEEPFTVGHVQIQNLTSVMFDQWTSNAVERAPADTKEKTKEHFNGLRRRAQGFAAGFLSVQGTEEVARQRALREVARVAAAIRFFAIAADRPRSQLFCAPMGQERVPEYLAFSEKDQFVGVATGNFARYDRGSWDMTKAEIQKIKELGLDAIGQLLISEKLTEFQDRVLRSISLFADAILEPRSESKLVYLLAAIESLYLKDSTEPIQQNLGERLAIVTTTGSQRLNIVKMIKETYRIRSQFVHHGGDGQNESLIDDFVGCSWGGIMCALRNTNKFESHVEFASAIDHMKLAGSVSSS